MHSSTLPLRDAFRIGREDAHGQADLLRSRQVTVPELIEAAISRIETLNPPINAITHRAYEEARSRARASNGVGLQAAMPLSGVPYLLKDSLEYPGMPAFAGSRSRDATPSSQAYAYIRRFDAQGLIPVGMTSMPEFGLMPSTEPLKHGPTHNPWQPNVSAGGSSGGAAAAVASGMVALAQASDAGGSIRIPAACCGLVGLKVSRGGNVRARAQNLIDDLLCSDILLSRSVRDVRWAYTVARADTTAQPPNQVSERRLRIAVDLRRLDGIAPATEVAEAIEKTTTLCARLGHRIEQVRMPLDGPVIMDGFRVLWGYLGVEIVEQFQHAHPTSQPEEYLEPWTLGLAHWGRQFGALDLERAFESMMGAARSLEDFFRDYDVVLSPVMSERPPALGQLAPTRPFPELLPATLQYMGYTQLQNMAGTPAISLPLFTTVDGIPLGSMFSAARGQDAVLLSLALELEQAQPWAHRWPGCFTQITPP